MNKLAFITTGGTIGAVLQNGSIGIHSDSNPNPLFDKISQICMAHDCEFQAFQPLDKISEDMTPYDWGVIIYSVLDAMNKGFERIVITHGTDTLPFITSILHYFFANKGVRICVTGSFYPSNHPSSDVLQNLEAATNVVLSDDIPIGVFVSFRKDSIASGIYSALDIKPMLFDDDKYLSIYGGDYGIYSSQDGVKVDTKNISPSITLLGGLGKGLPSPDQFCRAGSDVCMLQVYPGMNLSFVSDDPDSSRIYVVSLYHSGTGPFSDGQGSLIEFIQRNKGRVFLSPYPSKYIETPYESTHALINEGGIVLKDLMPHHIFSFVVSARACGYTLESIINELHPWIIQSEENQHPQKVIAT